MGAVRVTSETIEDMQRAQYNTYGQYTKISTDLKAKTYEKALQKHFDRPLNNYLTTCDFRKPVKKAEMKNSNLQGEEFSRIDHSLCSGDITVTGDKDSITCTWESTLPVVESGIPGIPNLVKMWMPKMLMSTEKSNLVARTQWTWKDGKVIFDEDD